MTATIYLVLYFDKTSLFVSNMFWNLQQHTYETSIPEHIKIDDFVYLKVNYDF